MEEHGTNRDTTWDFKGAHDVLIACVGCNFGPNPEERIDDIRVSRGWRGTVIRKKLGLTPSDVVAEIGSGCGFVGRAIAPHVKRIYCLDISQDFLEFCRHELADFPNVECHVIPYGDLSCLGRGQVTAVYATAVFIHFNVLDLYIYLREIWNALAPGGRVLFDYCNLDELDTSAPIFQHNVDGYRGRRDKIFHAIHYHSPTGVSRVATQIGFQVAEDYLEEGYNSRTVILRKRVR